VSETALPDVQLVCGRIPHLPANSRTARRLLACTAYTAAYCNTIPRRVLDARHSVHSTYPPPPPRYRGHYLQPICRSIHHSVPTVAARTTRGAHTLHHACGPAAPSPSPFCHSTTLPASCAAYHLPEAINGNYTLYWKASYARSRLLWRFWLYRYGPATNGYRA